MPTHQDETLQQRYAREHQDYLKLCGNMTAEQVADLQLHLHNALAREQALQQRLTAADERADVLTSALEGMLEYFPEGHSDGECFSVEKARAVLSSPASVKPGKSPYGLLEGIADLKDMRP